MVDNWQCREEKQHQHMPGEYLGCSMIRKKKKEEKERNPHSQPEVILKTGDGAWKSRVDISVDKV